MTESKLVAVLSADMKEYSRHMAEDEEWTLHTFKAYRDEMYPLVRRYGGTAHKDTGDGFLTAFDSAVNAVRCAVEIQQALQPRNAQLPPERQLEFRIGIHSGEVFIEEGELRGDAVNMTARIQTFAEAGGVCISEAMYKEVRGKLNLPYSDMGLQQGKSHDAPIRVYRIDDVASVVLPPSAPSTLLAETSNPFLGDSSQLLGREEAIRDIFGKLRHGHCALVGPTGSGKSRLLKEVQGRLPDEQGWESSKIVYLNFGSLQRRDQLERELLSRLGGQKPNDLSRLLNARRVQCLLLDDLGSMSPGQTGRALRDCLRGYAENYGIHLIMGSNLALAELFPDSALHSSPLANLDPRPTRLDPLPSAICRQIVEQRLADVPLTVEQFADLCGQPRQPRELLNLCAQRFEELRKRKGR